ncbi:MULTISPECIES: hypothetical protein [Rhodococcus]|uniref:Uncharacterized protein n=1 Tax=Rhodococcus rhodochrous TaxID=1829 RepID=A0AAW4XP35_RHORH|nr:MULTISPECIES: hypothetical protein [Rhodococcus]MCD2114847.1 hypothetical protein [Rhodococcus rhodochrous]MCZ1075296.1 hypothetical protein [Rhodococcus sp. A5(2022)]
MAVAVGASAHADHERRKATENITELSENLHGDKRGEAPYPRSTSG